MIRKLLPKKIKNILFGDRDLYGLTILSDDRDWIEWEKIEKKLTIPNNSVDIIISFYTFEHVKNLEFVLNDFHRILKPGGIVVGAIPCEGGIGWGIGRFLTSRRWIKKNTNINYDKIICWEHPNFADKIISCLNSSFKKKEINFLPFKFIKSIDFNLIINFLYQKK